ncbi:asparaginase [Staphylococcus sp. SQ8-PEA]|uniref:asparaginase n=1 Tax=Staphylococcus marylandisciuri TaxID=2981529 RepID=A0ABT2QNB6_9STAP|nr:asparaginase [Staphylococcus marylandisciuri]MCU5745474.1 asparaginase [Staphylococcus marylandisciuri]
MEKLLVIHTGGTISMSQDETQHVSTTNSNPIASHQDIIKNYAHIKEIIPFNVPSPHMSLAHVIQLRDIIQDAEDSGEYSGYVITHGTDTLEETAFLLDLIIDISNPITITGAMRSSNEIGSDGLYNYISAIRVSTCEEAKDKGVMVVFNDEVHTARNVTKTHTSNTNTFQSPNHGPLAILTKADVLFHHRPNSQIVLPEVDSTLTVPLIKAHMGMQSDILNYYGEKKVDGIIIEALGQGNLPPDCLDGLDFCLAQNIPIILVSRSFNGIIGPVYSYEGGGADLLDRGVVFSNGLNGPKARLKLLVGLSNQLSDEELRRYFNA